MGDENKVEVEVSGNNARPEKVEQVESNFEIVEANDTKVETEKVEEVEPKGDEVKDAKTANEDAPAPSKPQSQHAKTVAQILQRVKNDDSMTPDEKINTLSLLLAKFVEENGVLKNEVDLILENMKKHVEHKNTLMMMNDALKRQVDLVKEECELKLKEELTKRQESMGGYSETMGELSTLLETQAGQNDKLLSENTELSQHMSKLLEEAQKREKQFETVQTELQLQLQLLEAQLKKAQLEKAEIKCEMTQERMDISKELTIERDRSMNLERNVTLLREQLDIYEKQSMELSQGVGNNAKQFQHFKTQIEKLTSGMATLEKETSQWREKSELSAKQVQKMNQVTMEKDKELSALKKKLEGMVKLNQALSNERSELLNKVKKLETPEPQDAKIETNGD